MKTGKLDNRDLKWETCFVLQRKKLYSSKHRTTSRYRKVFYDHKTAGHPGELETFNSIRQYYWWPGLRTFVKNHVQGCGTCQQFKIITAPLNWLSCLLKEERQPDCSMDFITDLPPVNGSDSLMIVVD
jgi:hypothetical protein